MNYTALSAKFGIREAVAKKHSNTLTKQPKVHILRVDEHELTFEEPPNLIETININQQPSPILGSKKKHRRKLPEIKQEPIDIDEQINTSCIVQRTQDKEAHERVKLLLFNSMEGKDESCSFSLQQLHSGPGHGSCKNIREFNTDTNNRDVDALSEINSLYPNTHNIRLNDVNDHNSNLIPFGRTDNTISTFETELDHAPKEKTINSKYELNKLKKKVVFYIKYKLYYYYFLYFLY